MYREKGTGETWLMRGIDVKNSRYYLESENMWHAVFFHVDRGYSSSDSTCLITHVAGRWVSRFLMIRANVNGKSYAAVCVFQRPGYSCQ